jgi:group I intron endonuclease
MEFSAIYKIQSKVHPDRFYIGSTSNIGERWYNHLKELKSNKHQNPKLQYHFNKYGESDLQFSILIGCNKEDLLKQEQFFLDSLNPWFNILKLAGGTSGKDVSLTTRERMSKSHKGLNTWIKGRKLTEEHKRKISLAFKGRIAPNKGVKMSEETRMKMSKSQIGNTNSKGNIPTEYNRKRTRKVNKGNKYALGSQRTEEFKKNKSESLVGEKNHFFGKHHTEETKAKIRNYWNTRKLKKII